MRFPRAYRKLPSVIPFVKYRWKQMNRTRMGAMEITRDRKSVV
jgi:hypothetical protein